MWYLGGKKTNGQLGIEKIEEVEKWEEECLSVIWWLLIEPTEEEEKY